MSLESVLTPSATAHWNCNEASGNLLDSVGSHTGTDNNLVGTGAGRIVTARDFERGSSQSFTVADAAGVSGADVDWSLALWLNAESFTDGMEILDKWASAGTRSYLLRHASSRLQFFVSSDGTGNTNVSCNSFGAPSTGVWLLVVITHDAGANTIGIGINTTTEDTASHSGGIFDGTSDLRIGGRSDLYDGLMDDIFVLKGHKVAAEERAGIYDRGLVGRGYPFAQEADETVLGADNFTGANGTAVTSSTPETGPAWELIAGSGDFTIQSNRLRGNDINLIAAAAQNVGESDVTCTLTIRFETNVTGTIRMAGVLLRAQDANNFWYVVVDCINNLFLIGQRTGVSTFTTRASTAFTPSPDTDYVIEVVADGATISATLDGGNAINYASATAQLYRCRHGVFSYDQAANFNLFDSWNCIAGQATSVSAAITGTATASITEADVVAGGKTIIITLTGDTWVAAGGAFDAIRQDILDGLDSAQSEGTGWNAVVRDAESVTAVVRTSDTVVTITLSAAGTYDITAQETITVTVPASALVGGSPVTASPAFTVATVSAAVRGRRALLGVGV